MSLIVLRQQLKQLELIVPNTESQPSIFQQKKQGAYIRLSHLSVNKECFRMAEIKTITLDELDRLGVDDRNNLYWDKKPLVTEEKITLQKWVNFAIVIGAGSALASAIVEVLKFCGYGA